MATPAASPPPFRSGSDREVRVGVTLAASVAAKTRCSPPTATAVGGATIMSTTRYRVGTCSSGGDATTAMVRGGGSGSGEA